MAKSLGIFVTSPRNMRHIMGVTKAAKAKGCKVKIFFTWKGVELTQTAEFPELCKIADDVSICNDSYKKCGLEGKGIPQGLTDKEMATQAQHGAIIEDYDCYMTM
ncbi:MAG: peroxiredoxin [Desulfobulbaceae bacterium]|nr:peroxiredoxin [Desulfobulbaceae bacterium]HIJ91737.1 peroxiredoxin [Deltaproteobacteria bacterium]